LSQPIIILLKKRKCESIQKISRRETKIIIFEAGDGLLVPQNEKRVSSFNFYIRRRIEDDVFTRFFHGDNDDVGRFANVAFSQVTEMLTIF